MKVAIYSGSIPGPTFIENLIKFLPSDDLKIFLFGNKMPGTKYLKKNIYLYHTPDNWFIRFVFVLGYLVRLLFTNPHRLIKLLNYYFKLKKEKNLGFIIWFSKVLPVVSHLPDVFHIQWAKALPSWMFLKELYGIKIVLSLRGSHIIYSPLADKNLSRDFKLNFPLVDRFHAVCNNIKSNAVDYGAKEKKIHVIYSGIDINNLKKFNKTHWGSKKGFNLLSVGRFHWVKGYRYVLPIIRELLDEDYIIKYKIISNNKPSEEFLYQIADLSLDECVDMYYPKFQDEVYKEMQNSDCLILPSISEGIANVVLEAMGIGLPVISSDCGGMSEVVDDGLNGFLYRNRDLEDIKNKIIMMLNMNDHQREEIAKNAKLKIQEKFAIKKFQMEFKTFYASI